MEKLVPGLQVSYVYSVIQAITQEWKILLCAFIVSVLVSFVFVSVLRCFTGFLTWLIIFGLLGLLIATATILHLHCDPSILGARVQSKVDSLANNNPTWEDFNKYVPF